MVVVNRRLDQARLADILGTNLGQLQLATSLAVRLGFATRLNLGSSDDVAGIAASSTPRIAGISSVRSLPAGPLGVSGAESGAIPDSVLDESGAVTPAGDRSEGAQGAAGLWGEGGEQAAAAGDGSGGAVAVVVDAETTSFLMMGALSSGGPQGLGLRQGLRGRGWG